MTGIFDLHDSAYYVWRDAGVNARVLVHLDAHHDIEWAAADGIAINIGNFIRAARRDGFVSTVFWVVPDPMWRDRRTRAWILKELRHARASRGRFSGDVYQTSIEGMPVWVGTLDALPDFAGPVLLDVDVDYAMTVARHARTPLEPPAVPWCWPEDITARLRARGAQWDILTIATSVTGGFTPVRWQHLGRELAMRLEGVSDPAREACFAALRESARHRSADRPHAALDACLRAIAACEGEPAAHFHHAEVLLARNDRDGAREAFQRACALDPSYRHPFRTPGPALLRRDRLRETIDAFQAAFALDADDPYARLGLAMAALRQGRAAEALDLAGRSLAAVETIDGWRTAAAASAALGDRERALTAYRRAMTMSLGGAIPLDGPWAANPERRFADGSHWRDHVAVGALLAQSGDMPGAIAHYRIAAAAAPWSRRVQLRLALLEAQRHEWKSAAASFFRFVVAH